MKLYSVCHKEFKSEAVAKLTPSERSHVISYVVNERYPKDWSLFSNLVSQVREYELEKYNPVYQQHKYAEYGTIAHIYLNPSLRDAYVGTLHSDIVFETGGVQEMLETIDRQPDTIFYNTFFGPKLHPETLHPLYLTPSEVRQLSSYMADRIKMNINTDRVLREGWIGGMAAAPLDVFMRFGEFMETYCGELEEIFADDRWHLQTWPGRHTICSIIERLWGFYLVSLDYPEKYMRINHGGNKYQYDGWR